MSGEDGRERYFDECRWKLGRWVRYSQFSTASLLLPHDPQPGYATTASEELYEAELSEIPAYEENAKVTNITSWY